MICLNTYEKFIFTCLCFNLENIFNNLLTRLEDVEYCLMFRKENIGYVEVIRFTEKTYTDPVLNTMFIKFSVFLN